MAGIRSRRGGWEGLVEGAREVGSAPHHIPTAGERLIKELAAKQTATSTSLEEQLALRQNFVVGHCLEPLSRPGFSTAIEEHIGGGPEELSVDELCRRNGLTRQELEEHLSVKPNSDTARLYKFALSNSVAGSSKLLDRLSDHPMNNLKAIEKDFMEGLEHEESEKDPIGKKRKHRVRKKKSRKEAGCVAKPNDPISEEKDIEDRVSEHEEGGSVETDVADKGSSASSSVEKKKSRKSLWDVKGTSDEEERTKKLFTIVDGVIVEVTK